MIHTYKRKIFYFGIITTYDSVFCCFANLDSLIFVAGRIGIRVLTQQTQRYLISSTSIPRGSIFQRQHSSRQFSSSNRSDNSIMVNEHHVKSYEEFTALVESLESSGQPVHCLFTGGKDESGLSWCPYCNTAAPVVKDGLQHAAPDSHFVYVDVGERSL